MKLYTSNRWLMTIVFIDPLHSNLCNHSNYAEYTHGPVVISLHSRLICTFDRNVCSGFLEGVLGEQMGERGCEQDERRISGQCFLLMGLHYGDALMWARWEEPQPGSCCQVIELQLDLQLILKAHCCFLNCFLVSLTLRLIRDNVLR